jgi:hypothetical protein
MIMGNGQKRDRESSENPVKIQWNTVKGKKKSTGIQWTTTEAMPSDISQHKTKSPALREALCIKGSGVISRSQSDSLYLLRSELLSDYLH